MSNEQQATATFRDGSTRILTVRRIGEGYRWQPSRLSLSLFMQAERVVLADGTVVNVDKRNSCRPYQSHWGPCHCTFRDESCHGQVEIMESFVLEEGEESFVYACKEHAYPVGNDKEPPSDT